MANNPDKVKAVEIIIDSVKLFFTLSTGAFIGLVGYYQTNELDVLSKLLLYSSLGIFTLCVLCCIANIHYFIREVYDGNIDINKSFAKTINKLVLGTFLSAILLGVIFIAISKKDNKQPLKSIIYRSDTLLIQTDDIQIELYKDSTWRLQKFDMLK